MNHPAQVTPSWYGDSVGHYEGDTLVVDTVGVKTDRPFAMIDPQWRLRRLVNEDGKWLCSPNKAGCPFRTPSGLLAN
jgi:hypothetical protein